MPVPSRAELAAARADVELLRLHAEYCKVVANEHRLAILYALAEEERSVGDLAAELNLTLANVSQHLRVMKARGLVAGRREGRTIHYSVANPKLVAACHLIREALIEQHLVNEAIILGDEATRGEAARGVHPETAHAGADIKTARRGSDRRPVPIEESPDP